MDKLRNNRNDSFLHCFNNLIIFIAFRSFASSEAQEILKNRVAQGGSDYLKTGNGIDGIEGGREKGSANHLFKVASQDMETTYSRSLEISEKYESLKKFSS